jgi:hypothetical protein
MNRGAALPVTSVVSGSVSQISLWCVRRSGCVRSLTAAVFSAISFRTSSGTVDGFSMSDSVARGRRP